VRMGDHAEHNAAGELFNTAFEQDAMGVALRAVDPSNSRWLRVNQKFCDMLGYTREELLQLTSVDISLPDERHLAVKYNEQLLRGDFRSYSREKRYLRKDGTAIWTQIWLSAVLDPDSNPTQIISAIQDISERKEAEEALRVSEQNYRTLFENAAAGIERLRITDSKVFLANHKLAQIFGYERVWLQANAGNDIHTVEVLRDSYRRVMLMAQIHESLHRQGDLNGINARDLLNTLVTDTKKSTGDLAEHLSFHVDVDEIPLDVDHANACEQIVSELLSNSLKHAFANGQP